MQQRERNEGCAAAHSALIAVPLINTRRRHSNQIHQELRLQVREVVPLVIHDNQVPTASAVAVTATFKRNYVSRLEFD
jgi:hypothetical protein